MNPQTQLKGYQIMYGRTVTLSVWCIPGVNLERFCRTESIQVSRGVWTKNIRPAGRKDVAVTVSGLDFNTPDSLVTGYIEKFGGKIVNSEVIYAKHGEGPLKGVYNGDRKYNVEFSESATPMGTFHYLDGARVRVFYRGNKKTCGRCHQGAGVCPGEGYAKECAENGGKRVDLAEHMKTLWQDIGFTPTTFELPSQTDPKVSEEQKHEGDTVISEENSFSRNIDRPEMNENDVIKIVGIQIRNFPVTLSEEEVVKFLMEKVDEEITKERVNLIKKEHSMDAAIEGLDGVKVIAATKEVEFKQSKKKYFGKPLYCRILKNLTPEKHETQLPPSTPSKAPTVNLQFPDPAKNQVDNPKGLVKDKLKAIEEKTERNQDEKKSKLKGSNNKIIEYGLTNTTLQTKRHHKDVGSPTSPEEKKSPKKSKAGDKSSRK